MRLAVVFTKEEPVRFVSHLDLQRLFQRAFKRAKLPLAYSQGFNPHPLISFATALSVGYASRGEYLDVILTERMNTNEFIKRVSSVLPKGISIVEAFDLGESRKSLTSAMKNATYYVRAELSEPVEPERLNDAVDELLSRDIVVMKKTKGGIKPTDIRPMVISVDTVDLHDRTAEFIIKGVLSAEGGLNPDTLITELMKKLSVTAETEIERIETGIDRNLLV